MNYQDVPVSSRITGGIITMLLLVLGVTFFTMGQMAEIDGNLERVVAVNNLKIRLNSQMSESTHIVTRVIRTLILLRDDDQRKVEMLKIVKARADYIVAWDRLKMTHTSEQGAALRTQIDIANDALMNTNNKVVTLALAQNTEGATALLLPEVIPITQRVLDLIDENLALIEAGNQQEFEAAKLEIKRAKLVLIAFNALLIVVATVLGWMVIRFISKLKRSEDAHRLAASVFQNTQEAILITDSRANIIDINDSFTQMTGYSRDEALGKNPRILKSGAQDTTFFMDMFSGLSASGRWNGEKWNRHKDGHNYLVLATITSVRDAQGQVKNYVSVMSDITQMRAQQNQLEHDAHYDALTHLPNRILLADRLQLAIAQCQRRGQMLAVAYLDLDGFKAVNDQHGHNAGDQVLIELAKRMREALREGDTLSRLGGDEFVVILADLAQAQDGEPVLQRLLNAAASEITLSAATIRLSASIGVTVFPEDAVDADQLLRHADQAMYAAKGEGKNRYRMFDVAQDSASKKYREGLETIRNAIDRNEFVLYYQPKVNVRTGAVVGTEALIRWQHPERGLLAPGHFLPLIEGQAISVELGEWVISTALQQISNWYAAGLEIVVSVNVSALQLQGSEFVAKLTTALAAHPTVPSGLLELEIVESSALEDVDQVSALMHSCIALGVSFALDDFGTGYSSLTYLKRLPVGLLKIDRSFVHDMLTDPDDMAIVQGVVGLARVFKREVIAEGVETEAHANKLLEMGCELAQGYGVARPMPAVDFPAWAQRWRSGAVWTA